VRKDPRGLLRVNAHDWPRTLVFPAFRPRPGGRGHRRWTQLRRGAVRQPRLRPPGFDHAVATMLNIATSLRAVQDQADPDDLDNVPVFDTASNCLDNGPIFDEERFVATGFYSNPVAIATFIHEPHDPALTPTSKTIPSSMRTRGTSPPPSCPSLTPSSWPRQPLQVCWSSVRQNARVGPSTPLPWTTPYSWRSLIYLTWCSTRATPA
jgi:hypothetical protein